MAYSEAEAILVMKESGFTPVVPYPGSQSLWLSTCNKCNRFTSLALSAVKARSRSRCGYCSGNILDPLECILDMTSSGMRPLVSQVKNSHTPWLSSCMTCGRLGMPTRKKILRSGRGCNYCAGFSSDPLEDLLYMQKSGVQPLTSDCPGRKIGWESKCIRCDKLCSPRIQDVRSGKSGCKHCARSGWYNYSNYLKLKNSWDKQSSSVYLVSFQIGNSTYAKIGIDSSGSKKRIKDHENRGAKIHAVYNCTRSEAFALEQSVKRRLKLKLKACGNLNNHSSFPLSHGGTECWIADGTDRVLGLYI